MPDLGFNQRTPPTPVTGLRDYLTTTATRVKPDIADEVLMVQPNASPLLTLTGRMRDKESATQQRFDWHEKDYYPRKVVNTTAQVSGDTTMALQTGQGSRIAANYVLMNLRTREHVLVTSVSTDTPTIVRGIGSTAAAVEAGDEWLFTRPVYEEGSDIGVLKSVAEANIYNYTEQIRTPYGWTGRQENIGLYGGKDPMSERKWQAIEHKKSIEYAMYFGKRFSQTGAGGKLQTFTGGLEYFISSNVWDLNGERPTQAAFDEWLEEALRWGKGGHQNGTATKYLLASSRIIGGINAWAGDKIEYRPLDKVIGFSAMEYLSPHGRVMILHSPILDDEHKDWGFLLDVNHLKYRFFQGRDTQRLGDRQGNGVDGTSEEWLTDCGLQVEFEFAHAILKNWAA